MSNRNIDLAKLKELMTGQGIMISFCGPFSHSVIEELGKAVKHYLENERLDASAMMDLFSVYIEQTQNVRNYTAAQGNDAFDSSIVVIGKEGERYLVASGNVVARADLAGLTERLERLRGLDRSALRALYKETLRRPLEEGRASAGLGLIDMARKASEPLHYTVTPIDDRRAFFSLRVVI